MDTIKALVTFTLKIFSWTLKARQKYFVNSKELAQDLYQSRLFFNKKERSLAVGLYTKLTKDKELYRELVVEMTRREKRIREKSERANFLEGSSFNCAKTVIENLEDCDIDSFYYYLDYYNIISIEALKINYSAKDLLKRIAAVVKKSKISVTRIFDFSNVSFILWPFPGGTAYPPLFS